MVQAARPAKPHALARIYCTRVGLVRARWLAVVLIMACSKPLVNAGIVVNPLGQEPIPSKMQGLLLPGNSHVNLRDFEVPKPGHGEVRSCTARGRVRPRHHTAHAAPNHTVAAGPPQDQGEHHLRVRHPLHLPRAPGQGS